MSSGLHVVLKLHEAAFADIFVFFCFNEFWPRRPLNSSNNKKDFWQVQPTGPPHLPRQSQWPVVTLQKLTLRVHDAIKSHSHCMGCFHKLNSFLATELASTRCLSFLAPFCQPQDSQVSSSHHLLTQPSSEALLFHMDWLSIDRIRRQNQEGGGRMSSKKIRKYTEEGYLLIRVK